MVYFHQNGFGYAAFLGCFQHCFQPGSKTGRELTWTQDFSVQNLGPRCHQPKITLPFLPGHRGRPTQPFRPWRLPRRAGLLRPVGRVVFFSGQPRILFTALASRILMSKSLGGHKVVMILGGDGCLS